MKNTISILTASALLITVELAYAGSATWNLNPTSHFWGVAANWTPATVPDGPTDIATFGVSDTTDVTLLSDDIEVDSIVFAPGASAFNITLDLFTDLTVSGSGITNNSGIIQNFEMLGAEFGDPEAFNNVSFTGSASAGSLTQFTAEGG